MTNNKLNVYNNKLGTVYLISQIYLPFFRKLIKLEKSKEFVIVTTGIFDYLIAMFLYIKNKDRIKIVRIKKTSNVPIANLHLEEFRGQTVYPSNLESKLDSIQRNKVSVQWNGAEWLEAEVRRLSKSSFIFENGYFRPNSLTFDSEFIRNAPKSLRGLDRYNPPPNIFNVTNLKECYRVYQQINFLDICYRLFRSKKAVRPRKKYLRSASLSGLFSKIKFKFLRNKVTKFKKEKTLIYYGQVADDSSLILDPNYSSLNDKLLELIKICEEEHITFIYRPHPLENFDPLVSFFRSKNVEISRNGNIEECINYADFNAVFTSTVGFELLQKFKPVIVLGDPFYSRFPGVFKVEELKKLSEVIAPKENEIKKHLLESKKGHIIF